MRVCEINVSYVLKAQSFYLVRKEKIQASGIVRRESSSTELNRGEIERRVGEEARGKDPRTQKWMTFRSAYTTLFIYLQSIVLLSSRQYSYRCK